MSGNVQPIFSKIGDIQWSATTLITGSNTYDGTNAAAQLVFTADATNGGFLQKLRFKAIGTNVVTVARIFINNGSAVGTAANNYFFGEITLPSTSASAAASTMDVEYPLSLALPAGYKVYVMLATTVAAGWVVGGIGGKY